MSENYKGGFEGFEVWKQARNYRKEISELVKKFPKEEQYRLVDQLIRSARSIHTNIAEGYGRFHYQENIQFCRIARGSLTETLDHLITANDEGYMDENTLTAFREKQMHILKLINGYINFLKTKKNE